MKIMKAKAIATAPALMEISNPILLHRGRLALMMLLIISLCFVSRIPPAGAVQQLDDADIRMTVEKDLLQDPVVRARRITVETDRGVVTLSGTVANLLARDRAMAAARRVKGVRAVIDRLNVRASMRSDPDLRTDIENALRSDYVTEAYEIAVDVDSGEATLTGVVDSWAEKQAAADIAKRIRGLQEVHNNITVSPRFERTDAEVKHDIQHRLEADVYVDERLIDVAVEGGDVLLSGVVGSMQEKWQARLDAYVAGAESVNVRALEVKWWAMDDADVKKAAYIPKTDAEIKKAVEKALEYDPRTQAFKIDTRVRNGVVTFTGIVDNLAAKQAAASDAQSTQGVRWVKNYLKVRVQEPPVESEIHQRIQNAIQRDVLLSPREINIFVIDQTAYLYGNVDDRYIKQHAEEVVARTPGVAAVSNNLMVHGSWDWRSDAEIKEDVQSELYWSPYVDSGDINVSVTDGEVLLKGVATDWFEAESAVDNAFQGGARSVKARLELASGYEYRGYYEESDRR